jgi:molybdopterin converting factor small subunit
MHQESVAAKVVNPAGYASRVPVLRLFAAAREAAGCSEERLHGATVADVLEAAVARFGDGFAAVLATSKVWVNGDEVPPSHPVSDEDEVAVLPPVSGGA